MIDSFANQNPRLASRCALFTFILKSPSAALLLILHCIANTPRRSRTNTQRRASPSSQRRPPRCRYRKSTLTGFELVVSFLFAFLILVLRNNRFRFAPGSDRRCSNTTMNLNGFDYTRRNVGKKYVDYSCSHRRRQDTLCQATVRFMRDISKPAEEQVDFNTPHFSGAHKRNCCVRNGVDLEECEYEEKCLPAPPVVSPMPTTASEANAATATQPRPNAATATQPRPPRVSDEHAHPNLGSSQYNTPGGFSYDDSSDDESKDPTNEHVNEGLEDPRDTRPVNVKAEMELIVDKLATEDLSMSPSDVYIATAREIVTKYGRSYHGHTRDYVVSRVHRARAKLNHGDAFRSVENNMAKMKDGTDNFFFQCHHVFPSTKYDVLQRIMIFANPALLALLCAL